jgi:hypothetical protein
MIAQFYVMLLCPSVGLFCCFSYIYDAYMQDYPSQYYIYMNCNDMLLGPYLLSCVMCELLVIQWLCTIFAQLFNG